MLKNFLKISLLFILIIAGAFSFSYMKMQIETIYIQQAKRHLTLIESNRKFELQYYLNGIQRKLELLSQDISTKESMQNLKSAWQQINPELIQKALHRKFVLYAPSKDVSGVDITGYTLAHDKYHSWYLNMVNKFNFHDLFLIDIDGNIIYSVKKEADFATNLITGPWKDTYLGETLSRLKSEPLKNVQSVYDWAPYEPSNNELAGFFMAPIITYNGDLIGFIAIQISFDKINHILRASRSFSKTSESYLVHEQGLLKGQSRFLEDEWFVNSLFISNTASMAFEGKSGVTTTKDYRGEKVISAYDTVKIGETNWALLTEVDVQEMKKEVSFIILSAAFIVTLLIIILSRVIFLGIARLQSKN